jgi:hypothetical protein
MERMHHRPSDEGEVLPRLFECMNALEGKVTSMGRRLDEISSRLVNTKEAVQEGQRYEQSEN